MKHLTSKAARGLLTRTMGDAAAMVAIRTSVSLVEVRIVRIST